MERIKVRNLSCVEIQNYPSVVSLVTDLIAIGESFGPCGLLRSGSCHAASGSVWIVTGESVIQVAFATPTAGRGCRNLLDGCGSRRLGSASSSSLVRHQSTIRVRRTQIASIQLQSVPTFVSA